MASLQPAAMQTLTPDAPATALVRPDRPIAGGALFLHFILAPVAGLALLAAADPTSAGLRGTLHAFADGIRTLTGGPVTGACVAAGAAALVWLIIADLHRTHRPAESLRLLLVVVGGAGMIVGFLSLIYASVMGFRPDLVEQPNLPLTFALALPCIAFGGAAYGLGRLRR